METNIQTEALSGLLKAPFELPVASVPGLVLPPGWTYESHPELLPAPQRTKRHVIAHEVGGMISYVKRFKSGQTALYCTKDTEPSVLARLDDHQPGTPSHVEHAVTFGCPVTEEWSRWDGFNRKPKNQTDFAEFIEDNLRDIVRPSGAELLTAVTNFNDSRKVEFKSAQRLSDGRINFSVSDTSGEGNLTFPQTMDIAVPIFMGMEVRYTIACRVKYRIVNAQLSIWIEMDRPDLAKKLAYAELLKRIEDETALPIHRAI